MASVLVKLDRRRLNAEDKYPVKIIIFNNQTNAAISLGISMQEKFWIKDGIERPIKTSYPGAKMINDNIQSLYFEIRQKISDLELSGQTKRMKATDIKQLILSERSVVQTSEVSFSSFALKFADECRSAGTKRNYLYTIDKLNIFTDKNVLNFEDVTLSFLRQFDDYLSKKGSGVNTRSIHFRNIRAVFNRAIDDEIIDQNLYPFRKFKIISERKDKEFLTKDQVLKLYNASFRIKSHNMARDFWMLSFFMCGINPIDLFFLKKEIDKDGRVSFTRTKIDRKKENKVKMTIQPEAMEIINRYASAPDCEYMLMFEGKYVSYEIFKSFLSKKIREIAKITGLAGLTLYWARYSWATIADSLNIQEKTISKGLGHTDKSLAGSTYIAFDWSKVDDANRKVIDHVLTK